MSDLIAQLSDQDNFSEVEKNIADYVLENFRELENISTRQLAKETFSSSATIVRFCQKLGFSGYTEFKTKFLSEMFKQIGFGSSKFITDNDSINEIINKVVTIELNALKKTHCNIQPNDFIRALNYLLQADYIDFYAMDNNLNIARMAAESFIVAGKYCSIHSSMSTQYLQAYKVPRRHIAFFISRTGENRFLVDVGKILQNQNVIFFLITAKANSTLGNLAKVVFETASTENMEELGPRVFLTGAKYVIDVLFALLMAHSDYTDAKNRDSWLKEVLHY